MSETEALPDPKLPRLARPLALVGIMGAGKTSVGQVLARILDVPFVDSDHEIEAAAGLSVQEIFAGFGEPEFRAGERRVIARLLSGEPLVLATGGGAFIEPETRALIRARAVTVWLRAPLDVLWDRVRGKGGRPLLAGPDPKGTLEALIARRYPVYAEAAVTMDALPGERYQAAARRLVSILIERDRGLAPSERVFGEGRVPMTSMSAPDCWTRPAR
jgi:shikimate kinase